MTCADFDALLCDYVDNTLPAERRQLMEVHLSTCVACAEVTRDARAVLDFVDRSAEVEVPPELVTRILQQVPQGGWLANASSRWLGSLLHPVLQPRFFMGAMLTVLSLAMMTRCAGAPEACSHRGGSGSGQTLDQPGRPRPPRLGAVGKNLREHEACLRSAIASERVEAAAAGRRGRKQAAAARSGASERFRTAKGELIQ